MKGERTAWIDMVKGVLILFVILGHTTTNRFFLNWISSFYMPCFFFISGWLMKKEGRAKLFVCKKAKSVLLPYVFFALLWVLFCYVKSFVVEGDFSVFRALLSIVLPYSGSTGGNVYNLWFLPCLFLAQVIVAVWVYEKRIFKIAATVVFLAFFALGILVRPYCSLLYAAAIAALFVGIGFYIPHYVLPNIQKKAKGMLLGAVLLGGALHGVCWLLNAVVLGHVLDFSAASFGILSIYLLGALGGSFFLVGTTSRFKRMRLLEYIGKNSLVYYGLHYEVLAGVGFFVSKLVKGDFLIAIMTFVVSLILTTVVVWLYNRLNIGKLFR